MAKGISWLGADTQKGIWQVLKGSKTHDFAVIGAVPGETAATTITVTGARVGDLCEVVASLTTGLAIMVAHVSANDTVSCKLIQIAGAAVDLGSCTLTAYVWKERDL